MHLDRSGTPGYPDESTPQSTLLARTLAALQAGSTGNRQDLFEARESLQELGRVITRGPWADLEPLCRATNELLGKIIRYGAIEEREAINLSTDLVRFIEAFLHRPAPPVPQYTAPPVQTPLPESSYELPEADASADSFQLINESRLGEILVKMGRIDGDQLDRALVLQKVTHKKLGEVLVTMEAISLETLDQALDVQRQATLRIMGEQSAAPQTGAPGPNAIQPNLPPLPGFGTEGAGADLRLRPPSAS